MYLETDRLDEYGFTGWVGPEPHGSDPLNSGSSAKDAAGRDVKFAAQARRAIEQLDASNDEAPWLMVTSFVNPHDIVLWGLLANLGIISGQSDFEFTVEDVVPRDLFDPELFQQTLHDDLVTKPSCQASYQQSYAVWMQPIIFRERYSRFYYQLHKNVDERLMEVYQTLLHSRFRDDTIVIFTSDHGDLLGAHGDMHQKWYTAYDEALHVPLIISNPLMFPEPRRTDAVTSHIDILPTILGLAGLDAHALRHELEPDYTDALPLVGRDLAPFIRGEVDASAVNEPIYFMTDDDPSRGLNQQNWTGITYNSVVQPNHVETVITLLDDGALWKLSRYFDNPRFWSAPGIPNGTTVNDVVALEDGKPPTEAGDYTIPYRYSLKYEPVPDQWEMYCVTADPLELDNLANNPAYADQQNHLRTLLDEQRALKRQRPFALITAGDNTFSPNVRAEGAAT